MSDTSTARDALNAPTVIDTSVGPIGVHELSLVDGLAAVDRLLLFVKLFVSEDGGGSNVDRMINAYRKEPDAIVALVALSTDADPEKLKRLKLWEFLDVVGAFVERNASLVQRFFALRVQLEALAGRARPTQQGSSTS